MIRRTFCIHFSLWSLSNGLIDDKLFSNESLAPYKHLTAKNTGDIDDLYKFDYILCWNTSYVSNDR